MCRFCKSKRRIVDAYGLIGFPLAHSFSKEYFEKKFAEEGIAAVFQNYEIADVALFPQIIENTELKGLCVTIPHKESILSLLDEMDVAAQEIAAVNCIRIERVGGVARTIGYNTDYIGFANTLEDFLPHNNFQALVLGTGGAAKAVCYALQQQGISYLQVSRTPTSETIGYSQLDEKLLSTNRLIVNCTPLGTFPNVEDSPDVPYELLSEQHYLYDLVYNPSQTMFLKKGKAQGAKVLNGEKMLINQAEYNWEIWR